jgi:hypothetical protein
MSWKKVLMEDDVTSFKILPHCVSAGTEEVKEELESGHSVSRMRF